MKKLSPVAEKLSSFEKISKINSVGNAYKFGNGENELINQVTEAIRQRNHYKDVLTKISVGKYPDMKTLMLVVHKALNKK